MKQILHTPTHLRHHTFMPGHAQKPQWTRGPALPGVDPAERRARRAVWTRYQDDRRVAAGVSGRLNFAGALLLLVAALVLSFSASTSALERAALAQDAKQTVQEQSPVRTVAAPQAEGETTLRS